MATSYATELIRNIAVVGHAGTGNTTLVEALLHKAGAIRVEGSVAKGTTLSDDTNQRKRLQHSLDTSVCHLEHDRYETAPAPVQKALQSAFHPSADD
jgi:elongation factor G